MSDLTLEEREIRRYEAQRKKERALLRYVIGMGLAIVISLLVLGGIIAASVLTSDFGLLIPLGAALIYGIFIYVVFDLSRHRANYSPIDGAPVVEPLIYDSGSADCSGDG